MTLKDEAATLAAGAKLAGLLKAGDIVTLSGPLGAGKTTLVRGLLRALGHEDAVPSPSFALVQPYEELEPPIWHADLFRLDDPAELAELGLDSLGDSVLVVEWPDRAGAGFWPQALHVSLEIIGTDARRLTAEVPAAWEGRWPPR